MNAALCFDIFKKVIDTYHITDSVETPLSNPYEGIEGILYHKCWIDTVQWHLEDIIRVISGFVENWPDENSKKVMNLVSPVHPSRMEVHEKMAQKYGFECPIWDGSPLTPSKIVDSDFKFSNLKSPLDF